MRKYYYTSKKNGVDLICDTCGQVIFLKRIKGHEIVNGRLVPEIYEKKEGWVDDGKNIFCPECNKK